MVFSMKFREKTLITSIVKFIVMVLKNQTFEGFSAEFMGISQSEWFVS